MRSGAHSTAIIVGANLGLLWVFTAVARLGTPDHSMVPTTAPVPARLVGHATCYQIAVSRTLPYFYVPERIALVDSVARTWFRDETWRAVIARPEANFDLAWWSTAGPDSITVVFAQGVLGVVMRLSTTRDTLRGRAWTFTDSWDAFPGPDAIVRADPISCAEVRPAARRARSGRS